MEKENITASIKDDSYDFFKRVIGKEDIKSPEWLQVLFYIIKEALSFKTIAVIGFLSILGISIFQIKPYFQEQEKQKSIQSKIEAQNNLNKENAYRQKQKTEMLVIQKLSENDLNNIVTFLNQQEQESYDRLDLAYWKIKYVVEIEKNKDLSLSGEYKEIEKIKIWIKNHYLDRKESIVNVFNQTHSGQMNLFIKDTYDDCDPYETFLNWQALSKVGKPVNQGIVDDYLIKLAPYFSNKIEIEKYLENNKDIIKKIDTSNS